MQKLYLIFVGLASVVSTFANNLSCPIVAIHGDTWLILQLTLPLTLGVKQQSGFDQLEISLFLIMLGLTIQIHDRSCC